MYLKSTLTLTYIKIYDALSEGYWTNYKTMEPTQDVLVSEFFCTLLIFLLLIPNIPKKNVSLKFQNFSCV